MKKNAIVSAIFALCLFCGMILLCTPGINPFTNPDNIKVKILSDTLNPADTATIHVFVDSALTIKAEIHLWDIVDKITVDFGDSTPIVNANPTKSSTNNDTLSFSHIYAAADTFTITIMAISSDHQKTATKTIIVKPKPVQPAAITTQPDSQSVLLGQKATFAVVATGTNLAYQWFKNGKPIDSAKLASYTTSATTIADTNAIFSCRVKNSADSVTSQGAKLTLLYSITYKDMDSAFGVAPSDSNGYKQGASVTVMGNIGPLTKPGFSFTGWNTLADGSGIFYTGGSKITIGASNISLFAMWSAIDSAKALASFAFTNPAATGIINEATKTVNINVPYGTNVTALIPTFTTTGASVKAGATIQTSGTTANNFTTPVTYTVTAANGSTQDYIVTVTVSINTAKALTGFSFANPAATGTINEAAKTVSITLPFGTNVAALIPTFITTGASVKVGSTVQASGVTANNFIAPVTYTVTAADGSTQDYKVTVTVSVNTAKTLTGFSFSNPTVTGTIDDSAKTVAITVPNGTNATNLVATFTSTGASVKIGAAIQTSSTTANNFSAPVTYTVTAADGSTQDYVIIVTVAPNTAKALTGFSFTNPTAIGTVNEAAKTVSVTVPYGTNVTALVATFTTIGAFVKIGSSLQTSGTSANNFSVPLTYTIIAANGSTQDYIVTVIVGANTAKALTGFSFTSPAVTGIINEVAKTVMVTVPYGTNVTALIATFTTSGASVKIGSTLQTSVVLTTR
ncbi:MAG: hypothetical protein PHC61_11090 [Chitinivibrionales bacterium]|nr:hypothetical protein [Chitinivibrionales bacterium]